MNKVRLIDANALDDSFRHAIVKCKQWFEVAAARGEEESKARAEQAYVTFMECSMRLKKQPTVDAVPREWWDELESTVSKLVEDNNNFPENKQFYDCARFLLNLMGVIERRSDGRV